MDEPSSGSEAYTPRRPGVDLKDSLRRLIDRDRGRREGNRVLGNTDDPAARVYEYHVELDLLVLHPHRYRPRLAEVEQHAVIARHAVAKHEALRTLGRRIGDFRLECGPALLRLDDD